MDKLLTIFDVAFKMSAMSRFSQTHLIKEESVLEHTGFVCLISYILGVGLTEHGEEIDFGLMLKRATSHDMDEIITGDIPRPTKYYNEGVQKAIFEIEDKNMKLIAVKLGSFSIYKDWLYAKEEKEGLIIRLADGLAVVYKAYYETVKYGNKTIKDHAKDIPKFLLEIEKAISFHITDVRARDFLLTITHEATQLCKEILKLEK